jgi:hypothetical protein
MLRITGSGRVYNDFRFFYVTNCKQMSFYSALFTFGFFLDNIINNMLIYNLEINNGGRDHD